jgi:pimeloyl-ACP methyl ester carboxylesterase
MNDKQLIVGIFHGILTGKTDGSWAGSCSRFILARPNPGQAILTISRDYYEFPLPRLAALRNADRIQQINTVIHDRIASAEFLHGEEPELGFIGHSNGCVLAFQAARAAIANGRIVKTLILMSPALRVRDSTKEIAGWLESGMLESVVLVIAEGDKLLSYASILPRVVTWPWGSLGYDGWSQKDIPDAVKSKMTEVRLPLEGHSTFLNDLEKRRGIFENIVAPQLGLYMA